MTQAPRRVCVVTGARSDYGIMRWLIQDMRADPGLRCDVVATGAHFAPEFGMTYKAIEADGLPIARRVEIQLASDSAAGMVKSTGLALVSFADVFADLDPDVVVVLGDRYEIAAVAMAAFLSGVPLAHISGGEKTEGAVDDALRHIVTKCARYHFVAAQEYRRRVIQLGEPPENVFDVGDPGVDNIHRLPLLDGQETAARIGRDPARPYFLVTYHPATSEAVSQTAGMQALLDALDRFPDQDVVLTLPNADAGAREIAAMARDYAAARPDRVAISASLGQLLYLSAMRHCTAVVGNSSSGVVEAPAMKRPTVDIGSRQTGRLMADSILRCPPDEASIHAALTRAVSPEFQAHVLRTRSVYGDADASRRIHALLKTLDLTRGAAKSFFDLPVPDFPDPPEAGPGAS